MLSIGSLTIDAQRVREMREILTQNRDIDPVLVRQELVEYGYALVRGALPREHVLRARRVACDVFASGWGRIDGASEEARMLSGAQAGQLLTNYRPITEHADVRRLVAGDELFALVERVCGEPVATFEQKWVRVLGSRECTDEHSDWYRFRGCAERMLTAWIPLGDYACDGEGVLAVCARSHRLLPATNSAAAAHESESAAAAHDELPASFLDARRVASAGCTGAVEEWHCARHVCAGDVILFDIRAVHASTRNQSDRFRISIDTRWLPIGLVPPEALASQFRVRNADRDRNADEA